MADTTLLPKTQDNKADRILTWFFENIDRDGTEQGPSYYIDRDYTPIGVRVLARRAPDAAALTFTIKDDGVTIFARTPRMEKGDTQEDDAEEFPKNPPSIKEGSIVTLDVTPNGAKGISVHLELRAD